jgi:hypothetical protein
VHLVEYAVKNLPELQNHQLSLREATRRRRHYPDPLNGMISAQVYYEVKLFVLKVAFKSCMIDLAPVLLLVQGTTLSTRGESSPMKDRTFL